MPDVREKRVDLILQQLEELPTLPAVALRVLEVTGDDASCAKDVVELISSDPALCARILQLVHRADTGVRGNLNSIGRAVTMLGFDAVRNVMLAASVFETFGAVSHAVNSHFSREEFWKHCVAVGCCAELLAEVSGTGFQPVSDRSQNGNGRRYGLEAHATVATVVAPTDAFVCGLLHDLGKIALDATLPKSFSRVVEACDLLRGDMADVERNVIGLDHMVVGKRLCEKWGLPAIVRECVWLHGQDPRALPSTVKNPRLINLITLADQIVREQHLGYSGNYAFSLSRQTLLDATGLTPGMVQSAIDQLFARIEPRAKSLGLDRSTTTEIFQQALAQANKELGRMTGQLASKNRKLTVRAQFFEALSRFQSELRPDVAPQVVLQAIAQTAVGVLSVPCVAAFSLPPGQSYAETLLCDGQGQIFETSLIDLPNAGGTARRSGHNDAESEIQTRSGERGRSAQSFDQHNSSEQSAPVGPPLDLDELSRVAVSQFRQQPQCEAASGANSEDHAPNSAQNPHSPERSTHRPSPPRTGEGPVLSAGEELEWFVAMISPRLPGDKRFWICLEADGHCVGGVVWGALAGEATRLSPQAQELLTIANGWALALRTAQIREEARAMAEQLAETNRQLHSAQSEILRSRTMIAVGEMAAGAAHEMNNPLAVISGRSQLLAQQLTDPKHKAAAHLVHEQAHRLSSIITELMDFAKPESPVIEQTEVAEVIDRALHEAKTNNDPADRKIEVTLGDVPLIAVDARQVSAAVTEVIENAIHATEGQSGEIHLHAGYDPYSSRVVMTVTDNGCGMDETTVKKAFDPFFSAKAAGRRRGLGLAKALRWIEASGGSIKLESRPGQGTRTVILLPGVPSGTGSLPVLDGSSGMGILPMSDKPKTRVI